jgi:hypothetical protein
MTVRYRSANVNGSFQSGQPEVRASAIDPCDRSSLKAE